MICIIYMKEKRLCYCTMTKKTGNFLFSLKNFCLDSRLHGWRNEICSSATLFSVEVMASDKVHLNALPYLQFRDTFTISSVYHKIDQNL